MDARVEDLLLHHHGVGTIEGGLHRAVVTDRPLETGVVGLACLIVADDRRAGFERLVRIDQHRQRFVLHVDQFERVLRMVARIGDHERDLLALEAHLIGDEHRLGVARERGHPSQVVRGEIRAGNDHLDARRRLGARHVDTLEPGMRHGCPEQREVQHALELDVVDVVPGAAHEARVLLAQHRVSEG